MLNEQIFGDNHLKFFIRADSYHIGFCSFLKFVQALLEMSLDFQNSVEYFLIRKFPKVYIGWELVFNNHLLGCCWYTVRVSDIWTCMVVMWNIISIWSWSLLALRWTLMMRIVIVCFLILFDEHLVWLFLLFYLIVKLFFELTKSFSYILCDLFIFFQFLQRLIHI